MEQPCLDNFLVVVMEVQKNLQGTLTTSDGKELNYINPLAFIKCSTWHMNTYFFLVDT